MVERGKSDSGSDRREKKWSVVIVVVGDAQELGPVRSSGFDAANGDDSLYKRRVAHSEIAKSDCDCSLVPSEGSRGVLVHGIGGVGAMTKVVAMAMA